MKTVCRLFLVTYFLGMTAVCLADKNTDGPFSPNGTPEVKSHNGAFFHFGPALASNLNLSGVAVSIGTGYAWEVNPAIVKLLVDVVTNGDAFFLSGGLGGNYFLLNQDAAPYLAADLGFGAAKVGSGSLFSGQSVAGFVLGGGAGYQFLRNATVHLDVGLRVNVLLNSTTYGLPLTYALRVGLYI